MPAHRCSRCAINWPAFSAYRQCPSCQEGTSYLPNDEAIARQEAEHLVAHAKFQRFLDEETEGQREARRAKFNQHRSLEFQDRVDDLLGDITVVD